MPKFDKKVQKEVSQMANNNLPIGMLSAKCKLKPPKNYVTLGMLSLHRSIRDKWKQMFINKNGNYKQCLSYVLHT